MAELQHLARRWTSTSPPSSCPEVRARPFEPSCAPLRAQKNRPSMSHLRSFCARRLSGANEPLRGGLGRRQGAPLPRSAPVALAPPRTPLAPARRPIARTSTPPATTPGYPGPCSPALQSPPISTTLLSCGRRSFDSMVDALPLNEVRPRPGPEPGPSRPPIAPSRPPGLRLA